MNAILTSTLRREAPEKVPLAQELELVDEYLSIEEIRFADRLQVDMTPIVENAIRHSVSRCEERGVIQIAAEKRGARLQLRWRLRFLSARCGVSIKAIIADDEPLARERIKRLMSADPEL